MKYKIVLLIILFPFFALAQTKQPKDSLASAKLNELINSWTLGINNSADVDIEVYNKFKSLFDTSATIQDDLNVFYRYTGVKKPGEYIVSGAIKAFDIYAHDIALKIKNITKDSIVRIDSGAAGSNSIWFTLKRYVDFQKAGKYILPDTYADSVIQSRHIKFDYKKDSLQEAYSNLNAAIKKNDDSIYKFTANQVLRITMDFNSDTVRITSIKAESNIISCTNDVDKDAVLDSQDSLPEMPGDFTTNGIPDYDLDKIADIDKKGHPVDECYNTYGTSLNKGCPVTYFYTKKEFDVFAGLQFNSAKINLPELNQLGYLDKSGNDAMDVLQSQKGALKNPGQIPGAYAGVNFVYYFGKRKKQSGVSVGFNYAKFNADYELTQPVVYTFKSFDGADFYRRQITINSLKEEINYNVFNLPVLFNYRFHLDKKDKSVIKLQAGPSLIIFSNTSAYNTTIDFGGLYQIDTIQKNAITYYDHFDKGSAYNVLLTSNDINNQNPIPGADNVFQQLKQNSDNYDFANNRNYNGKQHLQRMAVAFNAGFNFQQKIAEGLTLNAGVHLIYAPLLERKEKYIPVYKTSDEFQSIYNSTAKSNYSALGVNVGLVYNW